MKFNLREYDYLFLTSSYKTARKDYKTSNVFLLVQIILNFLQLNLSK